MLLTGGLLAWVAPRDATGVDGAFRHALQALGFPGLVSGGGFTRYFLPAAQEPPYVCFTADPGTADPSGIHTLLWDGRLDYRDELAAELGLPADRGLPDAELVLAAYRRWDADWTTRLKGPFAAIILDRGRNRVVAGRDLLGRRPLCYHIAGERLLLSSEPLALLYHPDVSPCLDTAWLANYFALYRGTPLNRTPFAQVKSLLPGETLVWEGGKVRFVRPASPIGQHPIRYRRKHEYAERFHELLVGAVRNVLPRTGGVGIMLSGGMDSCPVACIAAELLGAEGRDLKAYSWTLGSFPEADERHFIESCADYGGLELELFPADKLWSLPDPPAWPLERNTPQSNPYVKLFLEIYRRAARDGRLILLQGTFGDQLYPDDWELADALRDRRFRLAAGQLRQLWRWGGMPGLVRYSETRRVVKVLLGLRGRRPRRPEWLTPRAAANLDLSFWPPEATRHRHPDRYRSLLGAGSFDRFIGHGLHQSVLGVQRRDPYHDWKLVDFMLSIPAYECHDLWQQKRIAREAMRGHMPEELRLRPRGGLLNSFYNAGYARSRRTMHRLLSEPGCTWNEYLERAPLLDALEQPQPSERMQLLIWQAVSYELWLRQLREQGLFPQQTGLQISKRGPANGVWSRVSANGV